MEKLRKKKPEARKEDLVSAAWQVFVEKGVVKSAVSDIVKAAGVAQGTFYLYFSEKNDIINAVVDRMVSGLVAGLEKTIAEANANALAGLSVLFAEFAKAAADPANQELATIYHRPENRAVHDRMAEKLLPRLAPLVEKIVRQGIGEGIFKAEHPRVAAWFVLGGLHAMELGFDDRTELGKAIAAAVRTALRALGYQGAAPKIKLQRG